MDECIYCRNQIAQYKEDKPLYYLKFCSYTCQCNYYTIEDDNHLSLYMKALTIDANSNNTNKSPVTQAKTFGPDSELPYNVPVPLRKFMLKCTKYIGKLSLFEQYTIWRYTIGSASINTFLIFSKISNIKNTLYWCYLFFLYWKNTNTAFGGGGMVN